MDFLSETNAVAAADNIKLCYGRAGRGEWPIRPLFTRSTRMCAHHHCVHSFSNKTAWPFLFLASRTGTSDSDRRSRLNPAYQSGQPLILWPRYEVTVKPGTPEWPTFDPLTQIWGHGKTRHTRVVNLLCSDPHMRSRLNPAHQSGQ